MEMTTRKGITGKQKAAILMITLGPDIAASIYKHLSEEEIEELTLEISTIKNVTPDLKEKVVEEFYNMAIAQDYITQGGIAYAKMLLEKSLGPEAAATIINRLTSSLQVRPFDFARKADPNQILNFIQNEHPQTIAFNFILPGPGTGRTDSLQLTSGDAGRCRPAHRFNG